MSHNFPCNPQGGKISPLNPNHCTGKTILGSINVAVNHLITGHSRMGKLHCSNLYHLMSTQFGSLHQ